MLAVIPCASIVPVLELHNPTACEADHIDTHQPTNPHDTRTHARTHNHTTNSPSLENVFKAIIFIVFKMEWGRKEEEKLRVCSFISTRMSRFHSIPLDSTER